MSTQLYASKKIIKHSDSLAKDLANSIIDQIESKLTESPKKLKTDLEDMKYRINNFFQHEKPQIAKVTVIDFGYTIKNGKKAKKQGFIVKFGDILDKLEAVDPIKEALSNNIIEIALYHDEITLVNPIGN